MHTIARLGPNARTLAHLGINRLPTVRRAKVRWIDHPVNFGITVLVAMFALAIGMASLTLYLAK